MFAISSEVLNAIESKWCLLLFVTLRVVNFRCHIQPPIASYTILKKDNYYYSQDIRCNTIFIVFTATAKIVYNADLHIFDNPSEETEEFISAVQLLFDCILSVGSAALLQTLPQ